MENKLNLPSDYLVKLLPVVLSKLTESSSIKERRMLKDIIVNMHNEIARQELDKLDSITKEQLQSKKVNPIYRGDRESKPSKVYILNLNNQSYLVYNQQSKSSFCCECKGSTFRFELQVLISAISVHGKECMYYINSSYINNNIKKNLPKWSSNGYLTNLGMSVKNKDLIIFIEEICKNMNNIRSLNISHKQLIIGILEELQIVDNKVLLAEDYSNNVTEIYISNKENKNLIIKQKDKLIGAPIKSLIYM